MKCRTMKNGLKRCQYILLTLLVVSLHGCKEANEAIETYDPGKPIEITDYTPKIGGAKTRVMIEGSNFGTDASLVNVTIGGKKAPVVNVVNDCIYCMVPSKVKEGTLTVTIGKGAEAQTLEAKDKFKYERKVLVTTLFGKERENGSYDPLDGTFEDSFNKNYGVTNPTWLSFDPKNSDILYLAQDNGNPIRIFDLKAKKVATGLNTGDASGLERMRTIAWTMDGDTMIIANDRGGNEDSESNSNYYTLRTNNFKSPQPLAKGRGCNGSAIHPRNKELYYNSFGKGQIYRYDYRKHGVNADKSIDRRELMGSIQDNNWEFNIVIHPSGTYAYIVVINRHYIMRMNYDEQKKSFGTPYLFCGKVDSKGWEDKVGPNARLASPYQGVFVENPDYVKENKEDKYDFYFCDRENHCVRILTPSGLVTTYAGRGSAGLNDKPYGNIDGDLRLEARFDQPASIAYDAKSKVFYVGDIENHSIRRIGLEEWDDEDAGE